MGRYVRHVLRQLAAQPDVAVTLLVRDTANVAAYHQLVGDIVDIAPLRSARDSRSYECVWYPWNGMRFAARAPALVTINDDFAFAFPAADVVGRWREQRPIRRAIRSAARIVTISNWARAALATRFALDAQRIDVIALAPDPFFAPGFDASPYAQPFVLTVGAGEARKNVEFLVDVFGATFATADVKLVIVGAPTRGIAQRVRALGSRVSVIAHCSDPELRRLYRTAAAVAVPSLAEGFGLVAAEAQACGGVVIASNRSALPEAIGAAGILIDPTDREAWSDALRRCLSDPTGHAALRGAAAARWNDTSADGTLESLRAALERTIGDGA
jgi:glycosyltransferase involved in cell wall biosynthesis